MKGYFLCAGIAALFATPAAAQSAEDRGGRFSVGITGGTLGIGPEVGYRFAENIGVRANATFLSISRGFDSDDVDYKGRVTLKSAGAMLDLFPFGGGFRLSGGFRINGNKARATAGPASPIDLGNTTYTPAQVGTLRGDADVKNFAPALTIGFGGSKRSGFMFGTEAGILFQGRVRVRSLTASGGGVSPADLETERLSLQDDVDDYKLYPILQFKIGYRFR